MNIILLIGKYKTGNANSVLYALRHASDTKITLPQYIYLDIKIYKMN